MQKVVISKLSESDFFSDGNNIATVEDGGMVVEITKKGIKETFNFDNYKKLSKRLKYLKIQTVNLLPQLISSAHIIEQDVANYHNPNSGVTYTYLMSQFIDDKSGNIISVTITIRQSQQKNVFWVHDIRAIEKERDFTSSGEQAPQQEYKKSLVLNESISQLHDESQLKPSKRGKSNREILADALETTIDESTVAGKYELKYLTEYKSKIFEFDALQKKLEEIEREIALYSVDDGTALNEKQKSVLRNLKSERTKAKNRLTVFDAQLLRLEATKPLKNVLAREIESSRLDMSEEERRAVMPVKYSKRKESNADRKSKNGELKNEYYPALEKGEWTRYYSIVLNGRKSLELSRYVNSNDDLYRYSENIVPLDGYEDQIIHGDEFGFQIRDISDKVVTDYTPKEFAEFLKNDPNYRGGNIRLISCRAGAENGNAAQLLAYELGVDVLAPNDVVIVYYDGTMKVGYDGSGKWILYRKEKGI